MYGFSNQNTWNLMLYYDEQIFTIVLDHIVYLNEKKMNYTHKDIEDIIKSYVYDILTDNDINDPYIKDILIHEYFEIDFKEITNSILWEVEQEISRYEQNV